MRERIGLERLYQQPIKGKIPPCIQHNVTVEMAKIDNLNVLHYLRKRYQQIVNYENNPGTDLLTETTTE